MLKEKRGKLEALSQDQSALPENKSRKAQAERGSELVQFNWRVGE